MAIEIWFAILASLTLLGAHVYVRWHTQRILDMIRAHRAELREGEDRLGRLIAAMCPESAPESTNSPDRHSDTPEPEMGPQKGTQWPDYQPPPCPDCETEMVGTLDGRVIWHFVTQPCDAHKER